jgi:3,4-dehydroadipyl-CoA semialdehyde dehydrogenase
VFVPRQNLKALGEAIATRLSSMKTGNPRNAEMKVGPVVNKAQQAACLEGLRRLKRECAVVFGGDENFQPLDADPSKSAFVQPTLLACEHGVDASFVHDVEVFGPAATLIAYDSTEEMIALVRRGLGSLVASIFANDPAFLKSVVLGIGDLHGRIMVVDSSVGTQNTGHGNVVPSCLHGGPGRAGGGEELAGLRALLLYHRRFVVQGPPSVTGALAERSADAVSLYS